MHERSHIPAFLPSQLGQNMKSQTSLSQLTPLHAVSQKSSPARLILSHSVPVVAVTLVVDPVVEIVETDVVVTVSVLSVVLLVVLLVVIEVVDVGVVVSVDVMSSAQMPHVVSHMCASLQVGQNWSKQATPLVSSTMNWHCV